MLLLIQLRIDRLVERRPGAPRAVGGRIAAAGQAERGDFEQALHLTLDRVVGLRIRPLLLTFAGKGPIDLSSDLAPSPSVGRGAARRVSGRAPGAARWCAGWRGPARRAT
ncbi:hypothetical protein [Tistlia consotensis]|uniref:hypothetical protein n=1 Tax=Tistlia consotensis TaxID=1321365 RepID=UPI000A14D9B6|nr:hypothetical protein [Tistlia consotensis]